MVSVPDLPSDGTVSREDRREHGFSVEEKAVKVSEPNRISFGRSVSGVV